MNKIYNILSSALVAVIILLAACTPDKYELGRVDITAGELVEGIAYTITHDTENPNIVYLESKLGSNYNALWNHPQGRSQGSKVTLRMPFEGTYNVQFGIETRGGIIYGETVTFEIETFCADFINDPLWTFLTGGVGKSKTWIFDNGNYGLAPGEMSYADPASVVEFDNFTPNWEPGGGFTEDNNIWSSHMTFKLDGGAFINIHNEGGADESGSFMLNVDNHTLNLTDAELMHTIGWSNMTSNWSSNLKILTLNENQLRVAIMRESATSGQDPWWIIWNYVSQEYAENYVPTDQPEPEPSLPDGWQNDISQTVTTAIKWVLSPETPFNWANLDGSLMNTGWVSVDTYDDWTGFDASIPATYANFSLTMDSKDNSIVYVAPDGTETTGTYTLDKKGVYKFSGVTPSFNICSWVNLNTSADNEWRITQIEKDISGRITGMWVGVRDPEKPEYMVYHLVPQAGSSSGEDGPLLVTFDNSKLVYGDIEENTNLRLEIYNTYGESAAGPGLNLADVRFPNSVSVTFTLGGITLKDGAAGNYNASIFYAGPDWAPQGNGKSVPVAGNGTYTVTFDGSSTSGDPIVFVVDIVGLSGDVQDMAAVTAKIDRIELK